MLDKLPVEVILNISTHLNFKNKLAVITTCRHLYNTIAKTSLFNELDLLEGKGKVQDIIKQYRDKQPIGTQVKQLLIDINELSDEHFFQLSTLFPNVTRITTRKNAVTDSDGSKITLTERYPDGPMSRWKDTLTKYNIRYDWPEIVHTLKYTCFPKLTELELGHCFDFGDNIKEGFDIPYFTQHIQHAPSLKRLVLRKCALDMTFLEGIHASCPHLESLVLVDTVIIFNKEDTLPPITPTNTLLRLELQSTHVFDRNGMFLDYITTKYTHLKELGLGMNDKYTDSDFAIYHHEEKKQEYNDIFKSLQDDLNATLEMYRVFGPTFFSYLPSSCKSLSFPYRFFDNPIETLAKSDIQPTLLNFLDQSKDDTILNDPNQLQYLNAFSSLRILGIALEFLDKSVMISPLRSVTQLMFSARGSLDVDWLLSTFPSLEELYVLGDGKLTTDIKDPTEKTPHLKTLAIKTGEMDQNAFDYFKTAAPNIHTLVLSVSVDPSSIRLNLTAWNLTGLNIALKNTTEKNHLYAIKTCSTQKRVRYDAIESTISLIRDGSYVWDATVHLVCNPQQNFILHGYAVSLMQGKLMILY